MTFFRSQYFEAVKAGLFADASDVEDGLFGSDEVKQVNLAYEPETNEVELTFSNNPDDCLPGIFTKPLSTCLRWLDSTAFGQCWWKIRVGAYRMVEHRYFETFIILMIAVSSLSLVRAHFTPTRYSSCRFSLYFSEFLKITLKIAATPNFAEFS